MISAILKASAVLAIGLMLGGCGSTYYWQASMGHLKLMRQRQPVTEVVADAQTPDAVRDKLLVAQAALEFAHETLGLPDNGSYTAYADTGRPYVVWNVVAAPEFSLEPRNWCFPVAGCISYRGYFDPDRARRYADGLAADGDDVYVAGIAAYSTLGRFRDPILNTMIGYSDTQVAGLIFHELAHQLLYARDDSMFNEGFASFVERYGVRLWLAARGAAEESCRYSRSLSRRASVEALIAEHRARLASLYAEAVDPATMRAGKAAVFDDLARAYGELRAGWSEPPYYDGWFDGVLNNARIASMATYDEYVPAFATLHADAGGDLGEFYASAAALAELDVEARAAAMRELGARRARSAPDDCRTMSTASAGRR